MRYEDAVRYRWVPLAVVITGSTGCFLGFLLTEFIIWLAGDVSLFSSWLITTGSSSILRGHRSGSPQVGYGRRSGYRSDGLGHTFLGAAICRWPNKVNANHEKETRR